MCMCMSVYIQLNLRDHFRVFTVVFFKHRLIYFTYNIIILASVFCTCFFIRIGSSILLISSYVFVIFLITLLSGISIH